MKKALMSLLIILLLILIISISALLYNESRNQIDENFSMTINQTESYLTIGSQRITKGEMLWESTYEKPLTTVMEEVLKAYSKTSNNLSLLDSDVIFEKIDPEYRDRIDILFINASGMVESSTDLASKDMDFSQWGPFYTKITNMRLNNKFVLDRAVRGFNTSQPVRIFGYQPTSDHKYLVEVIYKIYEDYGARRSDLSLNNLVKEIKQDNPDLLSLELIGSTGAIMSTSEISPLPEDNETRSIAKNVYKTGIPWEFYDAKNHTLTRFFFIESGDNNSPSSYYVDNIGKFVYSTKNPDQARYWLFIAYISVQIFFIAIVLIVAYWFAQFFFSPVDMFIEDLDLISRGDLRHPIRSSRHQEINKIASAASSVVESLLDSINSMERSEKRYYSLFSNASNAVVLCDGNKVIDANPAAKFLFGWDYTNDIEESDKKEIAEDDNLVITTLINSCKDNSSDCNLCVNLPDKKQHILNVKKIPIVLEDRSLDMLHIQDITEETRMHDEIHRLADIVRNTRVGIIAGPLNQPDLVNDAYLQMHCISEEVALKDGFFGQVHPNERSGIGEWIKKAKETGHVTVEALRVRSDGTFFPAMHDLTLFNYLNGDSYLILNLQDISAQKRVWELTLEKELLDESRNLLGTILDYLPDPTFAIDTSGNVISWNLAIQELTGVSSAEIIGKGDHAYSMALIGDKKPILIDLVQNPDLADNCYYKSLKIEGEIYSDELVIERGFDDKQYYLVLAGPVYNLQGRCIGAIESLRNITALKNGEKELMELNNKLLLLSSITRHDMWNKLLIIDGYRILAEDDSKETSVKEMLELQSQSIESIKRQIEFSKEYQDIGMQRPSWHNIRILCGNVLYKIGSGIKAECFLPDGEIYADNLIEKVFTNLADNSLRHGINLTNISISFEERKRDIIIIYEDNGGGIPAEEKEQIFHKGYGKNTGLGLFLIREILAITNITITENGISGKGARFEIKIPKERYRSGNKDKLT